MGNCCRFKVKFHRNSVQFRKGSFLRIETDSHMSAITLQSWRKALTSFSSGYKNLECTGMFPSGRSIVRTRTVSDVVHPQCERHSPSPAEWLAFQATQHGRVISLHGIYDGWTCCTNTDHQQNFRVKQMIYMGGMYFKIVLILKIYLNGSISTFFYSPSCQTWLQLKEYSKQINRQDNNIVAEMKPRCCRLIHQINLCV